MTFPADFYTALHGGHPGDIEYYAQLCSGQERVLELGCGNGRVTEAIAEVAGTVVGIETHSGMLSMAQARTQTQPNVTILEADMRCMGDWGHFHRIVVPFTGLFCLNRTELIQCLRDCHNRLTPGGVLSFDVYPPDIYHESDVNHVPYEWRTDITILGQTWSVDEEIRVLREQQEIEVSYRHYQSQDTGTVLGPTYTIRHHYVCSRDWSSLLYDAGFEDWVFWGNFEGDEPDEDSDVLVCWAQKEH